MLSLYLLLSVLVQAAPTDPAQTVGVIFSVLGAVATSTTLAAFKKTDYAIASSKLFKKAQPVLTLAGALLAPYVASVASSHVDISGFGQAPAATLGTVVLAEFLAMLRRST